MSKPNNTRFVMFAECCFQYFALLLFGFFLAWVLSAAFSAKPGFGMLMAATMPVLLKLGAIVLCLFFAAVVYESLMAK